MTISWQSTHPFPDFRDRVLQVEEAERALGGGGTVERVGNLSFLNCCSLALRGRAGTGREVQATGDWR